MVKNMWKVSSLLMVSFIWALLFPASSWAHSKLESSVPAADAIISEVVEEVSLSFNENIDENLSILNVKNEQGEEVELAEVSVTGETLKGVLVSPLQSGSYTVDYKIVSADGHPVEGSYQFQVDVPEQETAAEAPDTPVTGEPQEEPVTDETSEPATDEAPADEAATDTSGDQTASEQENPASDNEGQGGFNVWIVVVVVAAVLVGYFVVKLSRNRK
ncbi:hypothetical protein CHH75_13625 [Paenibacillus sp. 7541]|uniref:Copper resistance protein CopC n=2 Tax=Paenibacillus TaxID=44249 RepID=A0A268F274_9BACL|nr:copper resistance protein CopC [Paenibacillus campinasensis]MUG65812.1 copper resistance protein CopC [Paenibacillus campinasensis]PAD79443.1 hypothetical protein CHH67_04375 [Paenibacillus campinasensis]PAK51614.1 hypothetical protein CHH75_13625 [Paenibacillus sp. 7541]